MSIKGCFFMYKIYIFFIIISFSPWLWGDCQPLLLSIAKTLHPKSKLGPKYLNVCKIWPYSPDKVLIVLTLNSQPLKQKTNNIMYDVDVVVVDKKSGIIISNHYDKRALYERDLFLSRIVIDTARYQLDPFTRAFGVRFFHRNNPTFNTYFDETINLYFLHDKTLHIPLKSLVMEQSYGDFNELTCVGEFKNIKRILILTKEKNFGFFNIKVNEILKRYKPKIIQNYGCLNSDEKVQKNSIFLKYDGIKYDFYKI